MKVLMSKSFYAVQLHCGEWLGNIGDLAPSLELSDSNYISPSPAVFGRPLDYLLDRPDQSGVSGSIHSPTAIHRKGTLS